MRMVPSQVVCRRPYALAASHLPASTVTFAAERPGRVRRTHRGCCSLRAARVAGAAPATGRRLEPRKRQQQQWVWFGWRRQGVERSERVRIDRRRVGAEASALPVAESQGEGL